MANNIDDFIREFSQTLPNIVIKVDRKQMINQLRALQGNYIDIGINTQNLSTIYLKDYYNYNTMRTKN